MWILVVGHLAGILVIIGGIVMWKKSEPYWLDREKKRFDPPQV